MTKESDQDFQPSTAASEIHRVEHNIRSSRRWHVGSMIALGVATIAFFAMVGWGAFDAISSYLHGLLPLIPIILYLCLLGIREKRPPNARRELRRRESLLGNIYVLLLLAAIGIDLVLLRPYQGTVWAAFTGILPALPCFFGAWWVHRR